METQPLKRENKIMRGIILCGGNGTRLRPATLITNKHLLPVYDKPMIYYPIKTLTDAGIKDIMLVTGKEHAGAFIELLGSGDRFGARFTYKIQEEPLGIAHALGLCEDFSQGDNVTVILGDNIFEKSLCNGDNFKGGAKVFLAKVDDPERFGVAAMRGDRVSKITEKPSVPDSNYAVTGLYVYDKDVWAAIRKLKPSARGEFEITDVNNWYIKKGKMKYEKIDFFWQDCGTPDSLALASEFIRTKK